VSGSAHRVVLTNCVPLYTGDAAIALGILDRVADALDGDVSFVVAGNAAEVSAKYYPHLELRPLVEATFPPASRNGRLGRLVRRSRALRLVAGAWCTGRRLGCVSLRSTASQARALDLAANAPVTWSPP
jgi:hypothetical protein